MRTTKTIKTGIFLAVLLGVVILPRMPNVQGASNSFVWTDYPGVSLQPVTFTITDTSRAQFSEGDFNNSEINGTGPGAKIQLSNSGVTDPFAETLGEWLTLPSIPEPGNFSSYTQMDGYIYCLFASGDGKQFGRFDITKKTWEFLAPIPAPVAAGSAIANDGQYIYAIRGSGAKNAYFYLPPEGDSADFSSKFHASYPPPAPEEWKPFRPFTKAINLGSDIVHVGNALTHGSPGALYVLTGGDTKDFLKYSAEFKSWIGRASTPDTVREGGALAHKPEDDYIYATRGKSTDTFWRYKISDNEWDQGLASIPDLYGRNVRFWEGSDIWYPGSGEYIYAQGMDNVYTRLRSINTRRGFYRYGPLSGAPAWEKLPNSPAYTFNDNFIIYDPDGEGNELQLFSGRNYTRPWRYDLATGKWITLVQSPYDSPHGINVIHPEGGDYLYYLSGDNRPYFFRYSIPDNEWEELASTPAGIRYSGNRLGYIDGYIYCLRGNYQDEFWRYNILQDPGSDVWEVLENFPESPDDNPPITEYSPGWGSGVVGVSINDSSYLYAFRGSKTRDFFRYDVDGEVWEKMFTFRYSDANAVYGGFLSYPGHKVSGYTYIYAFRGNHSNLFYKYGPIEEDADSEDDIDGDGNNGGVWTKNANMPSYFRSSIYGASISYPGSGKFIYAFTGDGDNIGYANRFAKYDMDIDVWGDLPPTPWEQTYSSTTSTVDAIYAVNYYGQNNFWKYEYSTGEWNEPVVDRHSNRFGNMVVDGNNNIYLVHGGRDSDAPSHIWVYNSESKRWTDLIRAPFVLTAGVKAAYLPASANTGADGSIYVAKGRGSTKFYRYDVGSKVWSEEEPSNFPFWRGAQLAADTTNGLIYAVPGWNLKDFAVYNPAGYWLPLDNQDKSTGHSDKMNGMVYAKGKVYMLSGSNRDGFYVYNPGTTQWLSQKPVGDTGNTGLGEPTSSGGSLYYPGSGDDLYCIPRSAETKFYKYSISDNSWTSLQELPLTPEAYPTSIVEGMEQGEPRMFIFNQKWGNRLMRYDASKDVFDSPSALSVSMSNHSSFTGYKGQVYHLKEWGFHRYDTRNNVWSDLQSPPVNFNKRDVKMKLVEDAGEPYLYVTGGDGSNGFYKYSISTNSWLQLPSPPANFERGNDFVQKGNSLYVMKGESDIFWRYDIGQEIWSEITDGTAAYVQYGAQIAYPGTGDLLYVLTGNYTSNFFSYNTVTEEWTDLTPCIISIQNARSALIHPGFGDYLYLLHGSSYFDSQGSYAFLRYSMTDNTWEELTPSSFSIRYPGTLIWPGGEYFYAVQGTGYEFSKYYAFSSGDYISDIKEVGNHSGWGKINWEFNDVQSANVSVRGGNEANLSDALDWSNVGNVDLNFDLSGSATLEATHKYIQYKIDFSTDDFDRVPMVGRVSFDWKRYPFLQTLTSSSYDTSFLHNRLMDLTWDETLPTGTDIRLQLQTSSDNSDWSRWNGIEGETQSVTYDLSVTNDYAVSSKIKLIGGKAKLHKDLADFLYSQPVMIDNTGGAARTNEFVILDIPSYNADFWANVQSDGDDIRFFDNETKQKLDYNLSKFNYSNKTARVFIKIPSIDEDVVKTIHIVYASYSASSESDPGFVLPSRLLPYTSAGYWKFNSGSETTAFDSSGNGTDGTINGSLVSIDEGMSGKALRFDGSGYVNLGNPDSLQITGDQTISMWIKPDNFDEHRGVFCKSNRGEWCFASYNDVNNRPLGYYYGKNGSYQSFWGTSRYLNLGSWVHVAIVRDLVNRKVRSYTDGSLHRTYPAIFSEASVSKNTAYIGAGGWSKFKGDIDEVMIFDRALTGPEIWALKNFNSTNAELSTSFSVNQKDDDGSLPGWQYKIPVTVTNTFPRDLTDEDGRFSAGKVTLKIGGWPEFWENINSDGSDIRIVDSDGTTVVPHKFHLFDYGKKRAAIEAKIPMESLETKTIHIFYGNPDAPALPPDDTYVLVPLIVEDYPYVKEDNTFTTSLYYTDRPVIQPVIGVFYDDNLLNFIETATKDGTTQIKYQVSSDGYHWYWYNDSDWVEVVLGYDEANTGAEVNASLSAFHPDGDFYYRAYLSSDDGVRTPELLEVKITLETPPSYYFDSTGGEIINSLNADTIDDRYVRYKVTLYSDGENSPMLNSVDVEYEEARITVTLPNDGTEMWPVGSARTITWDSQGMDGDTYNVEIEYTSDDGSAWILVTDPGVGTPNNGSFNWSPIPDVASPYCKVRITSRKFPGILDISDNAFQIMGVTVTAPNGGEIWEIGSAHTINWDAYGTETESLVIESFIDDEVFHEITTNKGSSGGEQGYYWTIEEVDGEIFASNQVKVRIYDASNLDIFDESNANFALVPRPVITITAPLEGVEWIVGNAYDITWATNQSQFFGSVIIEYSTDNFATVTPITSDRSIGSITGSSANDTYEGSHSWTPGDNDKLTGMKIRVRETEAPDRDTTDPVSGVSGVFDVVTPYISVDLPASEDTWVGRDIEHITWGTTGTVSTADDLVFEYSVGGGAAQTIICGDGVGNGVCPWTVPGIDSSNNVVVTITDKVNVGVNGSSAAFSIISEPTITVIAPPEGHILAVGEVYKITWSTVGRQLSELADGSKGPDYRALEVYFSKDGEEGSWNIIQDQVTNKGEFFWSVGWEKEESIITDVARIKIVDANDDSIYGISDPFSITDPSVRLEKPNGGEIWYATGSYEISWTTIGAVESVNLEYSIDGGDWISFATGITSIVASETNPDGGGSYFWEDVVNVVSSQVKVKITDGDPERPHVYDQSDANFSIVAPTISVTSPAAGDEWIAGTPHDIAWTSTGYDDGAIRDELTVQYTTVFNPQPDDWKPVIGAVDGGEINDGIFANWNVPGELSTTCRVRVFDSTRPATVGVSGVFSIEKPNIKIKEPVAQESLPIGTTRDIVWESVGQVSDNLKIEYSIIDSRDDFIPSGVIATAQPKEGSFSWEIPAPKSTTVRVRITDEDSSAVADPVISEAFSIIDPIITIIDPAGAELWTEGDLEIIEWTITGSVVNDNTLLIEYDRNSFLSGSGTLVDCDQSFDTYIDEGEYGVGGGICVWTIPLGDIGPDVMVRVKDTNGIQDVSDSLSTILPIPEITIDSPVSADVWRIGTDQLIEWHNNGGIVHPDLNIEYSPNGNNDESYELIHQSFVNNLKEFFWKIPEDVKVCENCYIRIKDNIRGTTGVSQQFKIDYPLITISSPDEGEYWAVGDQARVRWTTEGTESDTLVFRYSIDAGVNYNKAEGSHISNEDEDYFSWEVPGPATINARFMIYDYNRSATEGFSGLFHIIPKPTITITHPDGPIVDPGSGELEIEEFIIGDSMEITWESKGLRISNDLMIEYYLMDDPSTFYRITDEADNTGSYNWIVDKDALTGRTLIMRIRDSADLNISDTGAGVFRIRGGFKIEDPNGGEAWLAKSPQTITWDTRGTIPNVTLEYRDGAGQWNPIVSSTPNTGSYRWNELPDIRTGAVIVRISDPNDETVYDESDAEFSIIYATVQFNVRDFDTTGHLSDLVAKEPATGWEDSALDSPGNLLRQNKYPYGSYTTYFEKTNFIPNSVTWTPPKQGADVYFINCYLENEASAQVTWQAILTYSFSPASDTLTAVGSLQRKGKLMGVREDERVNMGAATLTIYEPDSETERDVLTSDTVNSTGMYNFALPNTKFESGYVYPATLTISYNDKKYVSSVSIDVGSEILQYEFFTQTAENLAVSVAKIEKAVSVSTSDIKDSLMETKKMIKDDVESAKKDIISDTTQILVAAEESLPAMITEAIDKVETSMRAEILNRENTAKLGDEMNMRYRTYPGVAPVIDVYNADNMMVVMKGLMTEVGGTGIYEHKIKFQSSWGVGDYTIICSESSKGTMDALVITVLRSDLDDISGQVSAILGTTSGIRDLEDVTETLAIQFSMVESALRDIGSGSFATSKEVKGKNMETVYNQLVIISEQVKNMGVNRDLNLEKLYNVSKDKAKARDIMYLKNKSQELKAAMELNRKIMEGIASKKPKVQIWFEYR